MMNDKAFKEVIEKEIKKGESILKRFESIEYSRNNFGDGMALIGGMPKPRIGGEIRDGLKKDLTMWERRVYDILKCYFGGESNSCLFEFKKSNTNHWFDFRDDGINCMNDNLTTLRSYLERIEYIKDTPQKEKQDCITEHKEKPYKVFISHSSEDCEFVDELVKLLEFLGISTQEKLLCSSINGYKIPTSADFANYILNQFKEFRLFVIIVHSSSYYKSPYCLNEMGAAWVLKTDFFSFLVKGFDYSSMKGVINGNSISVKVDANEREVKGRLNELKEKLVSLFNSESVNDSRWEERRDEFLKRVNNINKQ